MIILMNTFSVVPSMLSIFFKPGKTFLGSKFGAVIEKFLKSKSIRIKTEIIFNLIAFFMLVSTFVVIFCPVLPIENAWDLCLSIIFISISYWENFISPDLIGTNHVHSRIIKDLKKSIELSRYKTLLFVNLWKIALIILIPFALYPNLFNDVGPLFEPENDKHYLALITQTISPVLCYYLSLLACKLCMQRSSFSLPLVLNFPIFFSIILLLCHYLPKDSILKEGFLLSTCANKYTSESFKWILVFGIIWWLAHLWVNRHVWENIVHRNKSKKRLFFTPCYSNVLIDQHLLLSRLRGDEEEDDEISMLNEKVMLYSCATMW